MLAILHISIEDIITFSCRIPKASLEDKVKYLSIWVDSHVNDSEHVLKKPVLFAEVGSQLHVKRNGTYDRNILLKIVYDKV